MARVRYAVLCFIVFVVFFAPTSASFCSEETLKIAGNGSSLGIMRLIAEDFQRYYPGVTVTILPSIGSTGGIMAVDKGKIDIGLSVRRLKAEELNGEIVEEPYGRSALVFGVQMSNPAKGLALNEIEDMYSGKRKIWPDGTPVRLVLRPRSDTLSMCLEKISPGMKSASDTSRSIPGVFVGITDQDAADHIEKTSGAFGVTVSALITSEKRKIIPLSVDNIAPTPLNVSTGVYPYTITFSMIYRKDKYTGALKSFVEFVFSRDGNRLLMENNCVPLPR